MKFFHFFIITLLIFTNIELKPQAFYSQYFNFVNSPHSVRDFGMGMQGVSSTSNLDALTFNPANLAYTKGIDISYYHQEYQILFLNQPMNDFSFYYNAGMIGAIGFNYSDLYYQNVSDIARDNPNNSSIINPHDKTISIGYARSLTDKLDIGADFRYCYTSGFAHAIKAYLFSIGINDRFKLINRDWNLGFSIMNLGPSIETDTNGTFEYYLVPPAFISLGITVPAIENTYLSILASVNLSRPFYKCYNNASRELSLIKVYPSLKDFPNDVSISPGLAFEWKPLNLGAGFSFSQNFYVGNYSQGIKNNLASFYTHGADVNLGYRGIKITIGYSGIWHGYDGPANNFMQWNWHLPYETFQFSISANKDLLNKNTYSPDESNKLHCIIISVGTGQLLRIGEAKYLNIDNLRVESQNNLEYSIESAFYINKKMALVSFFSYNSMHYTIKYGYYNIRDTKFEIFTAGSLFRYHPLERIEKFFMQTGVGITRINQAHNTLSGYYYEPSLIIGTGYNIELDKRIILSPVAGYNILLRSSYYNAKNLQGDNQFSLGIKVGYSFN